MAEAVNLPGAVGLLADAGQGLRHVFVRDLRLQASIGVYRHEHEAKQRICVNIDLGVVETGADLGDALENVVNYETVAQGTRDIVAAGHVRLAETLAERIAALCLQDPRVRIARVRVEKLDVFPDAGSAGVEIERRSGKPWRPDL